MTYALKRIDKLTVLSDNLAVSGQPSLSQFALIKDAGYQMIVRLKIQEIDSPIIDEGQLVRNLGLMYEEIPVSFNNPNTEVFEQFATVLKTYESLKMYLHCTAGYCTSGMLVPYLVRYKQYTMEDALKNMIVTQFNKQWTDFIHKLIAPVKMTI